LPLSKTVKEALVSTFRDFLDDDCPSNAAAIAYYAVFSLPAVLYLLLKLVGILVDPRTVQESITTQFGGMIGSDAARQVETMLIAANSKTAGKDWHVLLGVAALLFGASGAFLQLQAALNRAWEVKPDKSKSGLRNFVMKRVLSFGMLLTIAFLLLVSLAISALLATLGDAIGARLGGLSGAVLFVFQMVLSLVVISAVFTIMFKFLPDAKIRWNDVWPGGVITAVLFTVGKYAIGVYLGRSSPGTPFGAAGALALLLIWFYYSAMIVLLGAELTQTIARSRGHAIASA
jgi:membrane protein